MAYLVRTKEELQAAKDANAEEIIVEGDLAEKLHNARRRMKLGIWASGAGAASAAAVTVGLLMAAPTGGMSVVLLSAGPAAASWTGTETAMAVAAGFLAGGLAGGLLIALLASYKEVEFRFGPPTTVTLRKK